MEFEHSFVVPVGAARAWDVLLDLPKVAPCMPGATLTDVHDDHFSGTVKVKLGPINLTYRGTGRFVERDASARRLVIEATGRDIRSSGTATSTVTVSLHPDGDTRTEVRAHTDLTVTGRPAQFGRSVLADVGSKLIGQFAQCLADELYAEMASASPRGAVVSTASAAGGRAASGQAASGRAARTRASSSGASSGGARTRASAWLRPAPDPEAAGVVGERAPAGEGAGEGTPIGEGAPAGERTVGERTVGEVSASELSARVRRGDEAIDLLAVTGVRKAARRVIPYVAAFAAGVAVALLVTARRRR